MSGGVPRSRKQLSAPNSVTKQYRKTLQRFSGGSSTLSSNCNSSARSDDDNEAYLRKPVKNEDKDALIKRLQSQVKELRHKLRIMEECVESKECTLGTLAREKDRALGKVRKLEWNNKQLRQQLNDERDHYLEEKEKFSEEMSRCKGRLREMKAIADGSKNRSGPADFATKQKDAAGDCVGKTASTDSLGLYEGQDLSLQMAALRTENAKLRAVVNEREERNYELCLRFFRMKHSKKDLRNRFQDLENEYLQVITNLMDKIDEARDEFNFIINQKFNKPLHSTNAKYLKLLQRNSKIASENFTLRMELQNLRKELNKRNFGQGDFGRKTQENAPKKSLTYEKPLESVNSRQGTNGNLVPKASDTDSNYMSKTSTTEPSNGSLGEAKSSDSIFADRLEQNARNKTANSQNALFSDDILNKIFQRVDSQSSVNTLRDGEKLVIRANSADSKTRKKSTEKVRVEEKYVKELPPFLNMSLGKRFVVCSQNSKMFHEVCVRPKKDTAEVKKSEPEECVERAKSLYATNIQQKLSEEVKAKSRSLYAAAKGPIQTYSDSDRTGFLPKEGTHLKKSASWNRMKDKRIRNPPGGDGLPDLGSPRRFRSKNEKRRRMLLRDSCGLEENLETDYEDYDYETSGRQAKVAACTVKDRRVERLWNKEEPYDTEDSGAGLLSQDRNRISLHDELMEVTKTQFRTDDPFWKREMNLHSLIMKKSASSSRTYRLAGKTPHFLSEGHHSPENAEETASSGTGDQRKVQVKTVRNPYLSPEEYRQESQLTTDRNSDVALRVLMPPTTILSTQSFLLDDAYKESTTISMNQRPHETSNLMLQVSNLTSSFPKIELTDLSPGRETGLTSRTYSAPALIESEWLNPFKIYEMKDCSTNT